VPRRERQNRRGGPAWVPSQQPFNSHATSRKLLPTHPQPSHSCIGLFAGGRASRRHWHRQNPSIVYVLLTGVVIGGTSTPVGTDTWSFTLNGDGGGGGPVGGNMLQAVSIYQDGNMNLASATVAFRITPSADLAITKSRLCRVQRPRRETSLAQGRPISAI